jgi:hypothetical protein
MITTITAAAALVINELMAANVGETMSPATNFDSWIELYNPGNEAVKLDGLYLSDDAGNLKRWQMPADMGSVPANGFKVIWLGSNDIKTTQAPFKLDCDGGTIYLSDSSGQLLVSQDYPKAMSRTAWARKTDGGDEWGWTAMATPGATNATAVFASQRLDPPVVSEDSRLFNGTLQVSVDIPEGTTLMYTTDGSAPTAPKREDIPQASPWTDFVINGDCEGDDATSLVSKDADDGKTVNRIVDGAGYDSSRGIRIHAIENPANDWDAQFFVYTPDHIWRSGERYHFHMKVRADKPARISTQSHTTPGNYIYWQMLNGDYDIGTEWTDIDYEGTITDEQVGKQGGGWWDSEVTYKDMQTIAFNLNNNRQDNYFYFDEITWELFAGVGANEDTSKQSKNGKFSLTNTTSLTVRLFKDGCLPSVPVTRSYIKTNNQYSLPVVSIVGDKDFFTDPKTGIDCDGDGTNGKTGNGQDMPRNYNMDWDRPVNFSYLDSDGKMLFNQDVNINVSGGWTRSQRYRSFKLKSNKIFDGLNHLDYPFFQQKPYIRNKALMVRNGGNDVWRHNARFIDAALETVIQRSGLDVDVQSCQPVIEYVNGELRGVLNLREPNNDKFAYANWGYDDEELDAFENMEMKNGNDSVINRIFELGRHINDAGAYDELKTLLDIDEYTNYMAVTLFLDNDDWPNNNVKGYRSRLDGRYRFVSFDLDYAFAGCGVNKHNEDPFSFFYEYRNDGNDNQEFVCLLLNLLNNDEYRRKFADTFCVVAGSVFKPEQTNAIVNELLNKVQPMTQLMKQLGISDGHEPQRAANTIKEKMNGRSNMMTNYMKQFAPMKLQSTTRQNVTLSANVKGAHLYINGIEVPYASFNGQLFAPARIEAKAPVGYRFAEWKRGSSTLSDEPVISLPSGSSLSLTATFTALTDAELEKEGITPVRINEVSAANGAFVNEYFKHNDWIELYNTTANDIDVEGMYLSDNDAKPLKYQIAKGDSKASTIVPAHGYLVVWCDKLASQSQLHAPFKLAAEGGAVLLTAADGSWTDRLVYGAMKGDESAGRYPDGTNDVVTMNVPTIAKSNLTSSYVQAVEQPTADGIDGIDYAADLQVRYVLGRLILRGHDNSRLHVDIADMAGRQAESLGITLHGGYAEIAVGRLKSGVYLASVTDESGHKKACKFICQ